MERNMHKIISRYAKSERGLRPKSLLGFLRLPLKSPLSIQLSMQKEMLIEGGFITKGKKIKLLNVEVWSLWDTSCQCPFQQWRYWFYCTSCRQPQLTIIIVLVSAFRERDIQTKTYAKKGRLGECGLIQQNKG